jgi:hypothetical protein
MTDNQAERREKYAAAIRAQVRFRLGASVAKLAAQGRPLVMTPNEAEAAADAAMAVADAEQAELRQLQATPPDVAVTLTDAERQFLSFALDQAAEEMFHRDGFTAEDWAALEKLRRVTALPAAASGHADRAAVLREAADALDESEILRDLTDDHMHDVNAAANELRRMADETPTA